MIGDVGQGAREEVDFARSPGPGVVGGDGANYGWNCREGFDRRPRPPTRAAPAADASGFVEPVFDYPHTPTPTLGGASRCAIIGGYVVRDPGLGDLYGHYLYADLCSGAIRSLQLPAAGEAAGQRRLLDRAQGRQPGLLRRRRRPAGLRGHRSRRSDAADGAATSRLPDHGRTPRRWHDGTGRERRREHRRLAGTRRRWQWERRRLSGSSGAPANGQDRPAGRAKLRLSADRTEVAPGATVTLTARLTPCAGRAGTLVKLRRGDKRNGSAKLGKGCTASFNRRIRHRSSFTASVGAGDGFAAAQATPLGIRVLRGAGAS